MALTVSGAALPLEIAHMDENEKQFEPGHARGEAVDYCFDGDAQLFGRWRAAGRAVSGLAGIAQNPMGASQAQVESYYREMAAVMDELRQLVADTDAYVRAAQIPF